jgi:GNAT superfamily N-acetyltransferase
MRASPELLASLVVRPARREEVPAIVALYDADAVGAKHEDLSDLAPYLDAFDAIAVDPHTDLYVAQLGHRLVGTFQVTWLRHLSHRGGRAALVEAVHVAQDERSRGIGEVMMRFAIDEARRRGCHRIQLTSNKARIDAHRFYARLGFVASHEGIRLSLAS